MPEHSPTFFSPTLVELSIRFARPDDAETIYGFICALAEYEQESNAVKVTPQTLEAQMQQAPVPPFECLIAEWEAQGY